MYNFDNLNENPICIGRVLDFFTEEVIIELRDFDTDNLLVSIGYQAGVGFWSSRTGEKLNVKSKFVQKMLRASVGEMAHGETSTIIRTYGWVEEYLW